MVPASLASLPFEVLLRLHIFLGVQIAPIFAWTGRFAAPHAVLTHARAQLELLRNFLDTDIVVPDELGSILRDYCAVCEPYDLSDYLSVDLGLSANPLEAWLALNRDDPYDSDLVEEAVNLLEGAEYSSYTFYPADFEHDRAAVVLLRFAFCGAHRLYNFVLDSVQAALLQGVYCPGIDHRAFGSIHFDAATTTLQTQVSRLFALLPLDSQPLAFAPHVQACNGSVMAAWHCYNPDTPTWLSLSGLLTDHRARVTFAYFCTRQGRRVFVAYILIDTLRFALVFQHDPMAVIEVD
eukprot:s2437_g10.t1